MEDYVTEPTFYEREGHVEILSDTGVVLNKIYNLDFRFQVEKVCNGVTRDKATVGILGLSRENIQSISTFSDPAYVLQKHKRVRVYAGYVDEGEHLIIDGDLMNAVPTVPPENWLNMTVMCNVYRNQQLMSTGLSAATNWNKKQNEIYKKRGMPISVLLDKFVKYAGLNGWKIDENANKKVIEYELSMNVKSFDCTGTQWDIVTELNYLGYFKVYLDDDNMLIVTDFDFNIPNTRQSLIYNNYYLIGTQRYINVIDISEKTGMVGIPEFKWPYCTVTVRIHHGIKVLDVIKLTSVYNSKANGYYRVYSLKYNGQLRGEPWYVTIKARTLSAPLTEKEKKQNQEQNQ